MFICSEKAELFEKLHNYEVELEAEQAKKWVADEDVDNCAKCNAVFGWTVRKVRSIKILNRIFFFFLFQASLSALPEDLLSSVFEQLAFGFESQVD